MIPVTVQRALTLAARRHADRVALRYGAGSLTYGQLDARADRLACELIGLGLQRGDRVGVMLPNSPDYVVVALACAKAVLCMVPLNYRYTGEEVGRQMRDSGARVLIHGVDFQAAVDGAGLPPGVQRICRDRDSLGADARGHAGAAAPASTVLDMDAREEDLFYLGYTSGTTGRPKGAMVTQRNRALAYHYWALEFGIGSHDVALHCGPFHHTAPFTFVLTQLFMGGEVVILDAFDAEAAAQAISRHGVTWSFMVPYMLERLLETLDRSGGEASVASLRMLISGASPLSTRTKRQVMERFPHVSLHEFYGATEAGVITNLRPEDQARKARCVGQPVAEIELDIRSPDGDGLGPGEIGEIWLRGPTVFAGYFNAPEKTAEMSRGDWYTIGDIGYLDEEGFLYLVDRSKDVIKSGGVNVYPIEIEDIILREPGVRECAVVGLPDPRWGEAVHAFVSLQPGHEGALERIRELCQASLADYKRPKSFRIIDALPRNANGKVLKRALRDGCLVPAGPEG